MRTAEIFAYYRKSGLRNTTMTSDLRPELEIWPIRACAIKIFNKTVIIKQFGHCGLGYGADTTFHRTYISSLTLILI